MSTSHNEGYQDIRNVNKTKINVGKGRARLSNSKVKNCKWIGKDIRYCDGGGLYLNVRKSGKTWEFRYKSLLTGKMTFIGLGTYPIVTLSKARLLAIDYKTKLLEGFDPKLFRKFQHDLISHNCAYTIETVAKGWIRNKSGYIRERTIKGYTRLLEGYIYPSIGDLPIKQVTRQHIIQTLSPLEDKKLLSTLKRLLSILSQIFERALSLDLIPVNIVLPLRAVFRSPKVKHFPSLEPEQLPLVLSQIEHIVCYPSTKAAIQWALHTMVRPAEAVSAKWENIDWVNRLWVIPSEVMKSNMEHHVPLTKSTIKILENMKKINSDSDFVFASPYCKYKHVSRDTLSKALRTSGLKDRIVPHGFRSLASTSANESGGFLPHISEAALSHISKRYLGVTYNRATYLDDRRRLMDWWSKKIEIAKDPDRTM